MEITNEIKAKMFAQYLGQRHTLTVAMTSGEKEYRGIYTVDSDGIAMCYESDYQMQLVLRPISAITDEDAIKCYSLVDPRHGKPAEIEYYTFTHRFHKPRGVAISIDVRRVDVPDECFNLGFEGASCIYYYDKEQPIIERIEKQIQIYQYLQSKGYDLPHYLLGGKTLKEAGMAIYEAAQVA